MAFYQEKPAGDFLPYLGFNAKSDKWFLNISKEKTPVKPSFEFVVDFKNLETGWFLLQEGAAPDIVIDESMEKKAPQPTAKHKRGVRFNTLMKGSIPGVYSFSTVATGVLKPLSAIHDAYLEEVKKNPNAVPVVRVDDSTEVKSSFKNPDGSQGTATNYAPVFTVVKFIDRPKAFDELSGTAEVVNVPPAQPPAVAAPASSVSEF
jgi:hypothetical protein